MPGHSFTVSGEPAMARDTVYSILQGQGFTVTKLNDWAAQAERGENAIAINVGPFAKKSSLHVILDITCQTDPQGCLVITLWQGTSGWNGGLISHSQTDSLYQEFYNAIGVTFQSAGVLVTGGPVA